MRKSVVRLCLLEITGKLPMVADHHSSLDKILITISSYINGKKVDISQCPIPRQRTTENYPILEITFLIISYLIQPALKLYTQATKMGLTMLYLIIYAFIHVTIKARDHQCDGKEGQGRNWRGHRGQEGKEGEVMSSIF